jgi:hypothetical protein
MGSDIVQTVIMGFGFTWMIGFPIWAAGRFFRRSTADRVLTDAAAFQAVVERK